MKIGKVVGVILILVSCSAQAGVYSNDLSKCLVETSTANDRIVLVKWMFTAIAAHPAVSGMSKITDRDREEINRQAAGMFVHLVGELCQSQAKKAVQFEGPYAIQQAFRVFGRVAGKELFQNPAVGKAISGLNKYVNEDKLNKALGIKKK